MAYSDLELRAFSKIAYFDLEDGFLEQAELNGTPVSLSKLLKPEQREMLHDLGIEYDQMDSWSISAVHNRNDSNGFYACVIETEPGCAAVAFRGSEKMEYLTNVVNDWVGADIGLLNSTMTNQQEEVRRFLEDPETQALLQQYQGELAMTGHSLGGNLAEYATIVSSEYGLDQTITQCVSLDGPGFSDEFIDKYRDQIARMKDRMRHDRWSFVGTMLNDLPGVEYRYLDVTNEHSDEAYTSVSRHDLKYVRYDEKTGAFIEGEQDWLSKITSHISEGIDHLPGPVGDILKSVICSTWILIAWSKETFFDEDGKLTPAGEAAAAAAVAAIALFGDILIPALITIVVAIIAVVLVAVIYEAIRDAVIAVVDYICQTVTKICNWAKEKYQQLREAVISLIDRVRDWYNAHFNEGYRYAAAHPHVVVNTDLLRNYGEQLQILNRRISRVDQRMDSLYWKVGLVGLYKLTKADILTGYSLRLLACIRYLTETAKEYENLENKLSNSI